ncbi:MAG: hypothetical protein J7K22_01585 [Nanoarchaeota archaeon]|nr:hypothetical protein [Nanoarchaeota archaeon]
MNINVLIEQSEVSQLETLIEGWKIDEVNKIVWDGKDGYSYLKIERFGKGYKISTMGYAGFIFPNLKGIYKIKEEKDGYAIVENNGMGIVNLKTMTVSSSYDKVYVFEVNNGVAFIEAREKNKKRIVRLGSEEVKSGLYDDIRGLKVSNGVAYGICIEGWYKKRVIMLSEDGEKKSMLYDDISSIWWDINVELLTVDGGIVCFKAKEGDKERAVLFNGENEVKSEMFDKVVAKKFENGVLYFEGRGDELIKDSISIR